MQIRCASIPLHAYVCQSGQVMLLIMQFPVMDRFVLPQRNTVKMLLRTFFYMAYAYYNGKTFVKAHDLKKKLSIQLWFDVFV